ncbi:MAG: hypothetical protein R3C14_38045 [Caldilineaceae bacterium]
MHQQPRKNHWYIIISLFTLLLYSLLWGGIPTDVAQANSDGQPQATRALYLPLVVGGSTGSESAPTATPTATATGLPTATPTTAPTATPTATTQPQTLPVQLVATWFSGNAPLNDFYNPQTGEWRDVNGLGQMYLFAANGEYTYTGFLRLQNGACRSEVSTFTQGVAAVNGNALTLTPSLVKTRSVMICGSTSETITDGPYDPIIQPWRFTDGEDGHEQLTIGTASEATTFYKAGMVNSLVGSWLNNGLAPAGFYEPSTGQFDLNSAEGMWFDFSTAATYRFGEHSHGSADGQGCFYEWWIYQQGTIEVVGGRLTVTPESGVRRWFNSCQPEQVTQESWLDDARDYTWFYRDRATEVKLVIIPLSPFVEFIFQRP